MMDDNRRIRVWSNKQGTEIQIVRSTGEPRPNYIIERDYRPITKASAYRVTRLIEHIPANGIYVHSWGFVGCWFIP